MLLVRGTSRSIVREATERNASSGRGTAQLYKALKERLRAHELYTV